MSCEHEVRFTIKPTDDACRFHFDVRAYKDRIVAPDEYSGATEVTPSHIEQVLPTTDKLVRDDITVLPAPTEYLSTDHNGTFTPSEGKVGFYQVDVDVNPDLRPLSVSENGSYQPDGFDGYSDVTVDVEPALESLSVTENGLYLPESGVDGYSVVSVDVPTGSIPSYDDVVLPSEYQRVEYIESSGTQYIDLPFGFYPTDTVDILASFNTLATDKSMASPTRWNNNNNRFSPYYCQEMRGTMYFGVGYGNNATGNTLFSLNSVADTDLHRVVYSNLIFAMTDKGISLGAGNSLFGIETDNLRLFYGYNANTSGKMSHFVHKKADGRKIALFACYRKSDGVIGMYDIKNDVFYTNNGTGNFTKGQDI